MTTSDAKRRKAARMAARLRRLLRRERELWEQGMTRVAGVDEAGVGPLAGPVVAAAVVFPCGSGVKGVDDSKRLPPERRLELAEAIRGTAACYRVALAGPEEIDALNIYQAGLLAMRRAVEGLGVEPDYVLVDGRRIPELSVPQETVIGGDAKCHAIAAASILAKTERDAAMLRFEAEYPGYGFAAHKGYPTAAHRDAIRRLGPSPIHRRSFTLLPQPRLFD
jgi:ribonuclease HII